VLDAFAQSEDGKFFSFDLRLALIARHLETF